MICVGLSFLIGCSSTPGPDLVITGDSGGLVSAYKTRAMKAKEDNLRIVIDGTCYSACLYYLSTYSSNRHCATERASLGFHGTYYIDGSGNIVRSVELDQLSIEQTNYFLDSLHPRLRDRYLSTGFPSVYQGDSPSDMSIISGQEAIKILGKC